MRCAAAITLLLVATQSFGQSVSLSGSLGDKALLIIDGTPRTVATGATVQGVKLIAVGSNGATVEVNGKRQVLVLGAAQVNLGAASGPREPGASQIVMVATSGGHFLASGAINGKAVRFLVDTGATYVSLGADEAERLGIDYRKGQRTMSNTANGPIAAYRVSLASVRVGEVELYNVDALVSQAPLEPMLLGNSFLTRFQMKRENDTMTLVKRY